MDNLSPGRAAYLTRMRRETRSVRLWQAALLLALLALWEISTRLGWSDGFLISSPSRMAATTRERLWWSMRSSQRITSPAVQKP